MAQGLPVALAEPSSALPEIGGEAGWYFDPKSEDAIANTIRRLLDDPGERGRRATLGRMIAGHYRWQAANDLLVDALLSRRRGSDLSAPRPRRKACEPREGEAHRFG